MAPFWQDDHLTLYGGDCRAVLAGMPGESVHCVVTSPPYWGLRDYGTATWDGGDPACDHVQTRNLKRDTNGGMLPAGEGTRGTQSSTASSAIGYRDTCGKCGARRVDSQLGLEPTPEEYVANMVAVFREVRRVLRADGTLWLNLGDSYATDTKGSGGTGKSGLMRDGRDEAQRLVTADGSIGHQKFTPQRFDHGLKPKDLVGIPWRVAFALQADGWYLRSDIIWSKPNPMPESVTDRPTKAHEYLFLLSKSPRYYFDSDAVREADSGQDHRRTIDLPQPSLEPSGGLAGPHTGLRTIDGRNGRNLRTVWTIATEPYPGAHFATFPRKLVEPCVKAGTSERGVCPECGAPWVRVVERTAMVLRRSERTHPMGQTRSSGTMVSPPTSETTGWRPSCAHTAPDGERVAEREDGTAEIVPTWSDAIPTAAAQVLDPFAGSGTTLLVAQSLGRRGVGIDLNPEYLHQALVRNAQTPLGLLG